MGFFGVVLGGGRQEEEKKKEKTQFIFFCQPHKTPSGSKKKEENKRAGCNSLALLELSLSVLYALVKTMFARESSRRAGSEAQGEGRERV